MGHWPHPCNGQNVGLVYPMAKCKSTWWAKYWSTWWAKRTFFSTGGEARSPFHDMSVYPVGKTQIYPIGKTLVYPKTKLCPPFGHGFDLFAQKDWPTHTLSRIKQLETNLQAHSHTPYYLTLSKQRETILDMTLQLFPMLYRLYKNYPDHIKILNGKLRMRAKLKKLKPIQNCHKYYFKVECDRTL